MPQHVLRFWETRFSFIRPMKRAGGRRFYRPQDVAVLQALKARLHDDHLSIKDVQRLYKEVGLERVLHPVKGESAESVVLDAIPGPETHIELEAISSGFLPRLTSESEMRLRLTLTGLLATKQRLDSILKRPSA